MALAPAIVFCDMDGTLLASDKSLPPQNAYALDLLAERGIPFVPCTGRPVVGVPEEILAHDAVRYVIGANGGVVHDVRAGANLMSSGIDKDGVLTLYARVRDWPMTFDVFADGVVYSERARYDSMGTLGIDSATLETLRRVRTPVDLMVPQIVERATCVEKLTCFFGDLGLRDRLEAVAREVGCFSFARGDRNDLELMAPGVSKGTALLWLCEHLSVPVSSAVAFGDEDNDASMISVAGDGVAMANATEAVRAVADHVAPSNDDAGVGCYLLSLI